LRGHETISPSDWSERERKRERESRRVREREKEGEREGGRERGRERERDVEYGCFIFIFKRNYRCLGTF
jgi:hypothetical protein